MEIDSKSVGRRCVIHMRTKSWAVLKLIFQSTPIYKDLRPIYSFIMPPKSSAMSSTASSVPKSPPKARRSTRKRAQSSTSVTAEPPVKKIAPSAEADKDEEKSAPKPRRGKASKGKATRCVTDL